MSTNEGLVRGKSSVQVRPLTETLLLATILVLFLLLHALAGAMLQAADTVDHASAEPDIRDMALRLHD
jgi:hypothetical protein